MHLVQNLFANVRRASKYPEVIFKGYVEDDNFGVYTHTHSHRDLDSM